MAQSQGHVPTAGMNSHCSATVANTQLFTVTTKTLTKTQQPGCSWQLPVWPPGTHLHHQQLDLLLFLGLFCFWWRAQALQHMELISERKMYRFTTLE